MKVIVDNKVPYIREALEKLADEVVYLPGKDFTPEVVRDADALITRTRTRCDRHLLEESRVKFIGTATIGFDHIDTEYCKEAGITWANCPGCNAGAVEQYLHSVLFLLEQQKGMNLKECCIGIVGVGHVGSRIADLAGRLGMRVLLNDPPREEQGEKGFVSLETLAQECDIISFHTPLERGGSHPTFHLGNRAFFASLKRKPVIINTSRGEVIDENALLEALDRQEVRDAVIDVWEHEPGISLTLLERIFIGTPHIAGYSADGKANATRMTLDSFCRFFGLKADFTICPPEMQHPPFDSDERIRQLQVYDPRNDCRELRAHPELFEQLRGDYPLRREY